MVTVSLTPLDFIRRCGMEEALKVLRFYKEEYDWYTFKCIKRKEAKFLVFTYCAFSDWNYYQLLSVLKVKLSSIQLLIQIHAFN